MGKTFAKIKLCHTNDFPQPQNEGIKRCVENNGGIFQQGISADTTHLVCSKKAWKRYHPLVKEARRRNRALPRSKKIKIVKYDWLEDSLTSKSRKPKDTTLYDWEQKRVVHKPTPTSSCMTTTQDSGPAEKKVAKIDSKMIEFNKEIEEFEEVMQTEGYHPYTDSTGFLYLIVLIRRDIEKNLIERHRIKLFESNITPRTYACYLSYTAGRPGVKKETQDLAPVGSTWEFAWAMFTKVFKLKTGVAWNERPGLSERPHATHLQIDGATAGILKKHFEYMPPRMNSPHGLRYSAGFTDMTSVKTRNSEEKVAENARQGINGTPERRSNVTLVMPGMAALDDVEVSARTPESGW